MGNDLRGDENGHDQSNGGLEQKRRDQGSLAGTAEFPVEHAEAKRAEHKENDGQQRLHPREGRRGDRLI